MKEQVFTTMTSASSARDTSFAPAWSSMPIMTSLSTRFLGQPRLTNPTLGAAGLARLGAETGKDFAGIQLLLILALSQKTPPKLGVAFRRAPDPLTGGPHYLGYLRTRYGED